MGTNLAAQHRRRQHVVEQRALGRAREVDTYPPSRPPCLIHSTRTTSSSATTADCTRPTISARPGSSMQRFRSRSTIASRHQQRQAVLLRVWRHAGQLLASADRRAPTNTWGIRNSDWFNIVGGDGFQVEWPHGRPVRLLRASRRTAACRASTCARAGGQGIRPTTALGWR